MKINRFFRFMLIAAASWGVLITLIILSLWALQMLFGLILPIPPC